MVNMAVYNLVIITAFATLWRKKHPSYDIDLPAYCSCAIATFMSLQLCLSET